MVQIPFLLILIGILAFIAFKYPNPITFMVAGGITITTAFLWYETFTDSYGLATALCILIFAIFLFAMAFRAMFFNRGQSEEDDEE